MSNESSLPTLHATELTRFGDRVWPEVSAFTWEDLAQARNQQLTAMFRADSNAHRKIYLLAPEMERLEQAANEYRKRLLIEYLWRTGCRVNEAVGKKGVTADYIIGTKRLLTIHQRQLKNTVNTHRTITLPEPPHGEFNDRLLALREFRIRESGKDAGLWPISDTTARHWIQAAGIAARSELDATSPFLGGLHAQWPITPHVIRHSRAMQIVIDQDYGVDGWKSEIQRQLGHRHQHSADAYTAFVEAILTMRKPSRGRF
ncbi:site-specific integrase [Gammaproteobacteria bacterium]|nr:site-specific integrase [Gammaproteobacteria bacterium]